MKCPACSNETMVHHHVRRFDMIATVAWYLFSALAIGGAALAFMNMEAIGPRSIDAFIGSIVSGLILATLPTVLVLSRVPVWACYNCGHWMNRTLPPAPRR